MMKVSTSLVAGLGLIAASGFITPASAADAPNSTDNSMATQAPTRSQANDYQANSQAGGSQSPQYSASVGLAQGQSANLSQKTIMELQQALNDQGDKLSSDGVWGPATANALKRYQQKNGLAVTGQLDDATRSKLNLKNES
jgi:murein L,D-transpeptidase YcbB/YkuD